MSLADALSMVKKDAKFFWLYSAAAVVVGITALKGTFLLILTGTCFLFLYELLGSFKNWRGIRKESVIFLAIKKSEEKRNCVLQPL